MFKNSLYYIIRHPCLHRLSPFAPFFLDLQREREQVSIRHLECQAGDVGESHLVGKTVSHEADGIGSCAGNPLEGNDLLWLDGVVLCFSHSLEEGSLIPALVAIHVWFTD